MNKTTRNIIGVVLTILLGFWVYYFFPMNMKSDERVRPVGAGDESKNTSPTLDGSTKTEFSPLVSAPYKFGVMYPSKYFVSAIELDASTTPHLAVVMVLDTKENRDALEGRSATPREGANGITVNAYRNPSALTPEEWATKDMNWNVSDKKLATTTVAGGGGVVFRWSGLYEGASVVTTRGEFAYVFAVSWQSETDPILADFDQILQSLRFDGAP
jgi:hypothetical protein